MGLHWDRKQKPPIHSWNRFSTKRKSIWAIWRLSKPLKWYVKAHARKQNDIWTFYMKTALQHSWEMLAYQTSHLVGVGCSVIESSYVDNEADFVEPGLAKSGRGRQVSARCIRAIAWHSNQYQGITGIGCNLAPSRCGTSAKDIDRSQWDGRPDGRSVGVTGSKATAAGSKSALVPFSLCLWVPRVI